jgi:RNA polymerase sigma factor FliA
MSRLAAYREVPAANQEQLVAAHATLVRRIAYHLKGRLPAAVQTDDLVQAGMLGLLEAARNFDPGQGASFETYAGIRIRGAMLDEARRHDWAPRSLHRRQREVAEVIRELEIEAGREPTDAEVSGRLGISLDEYHRILADASSQRLFSLEELPAAADTISEGLGGAASGPLEQLEASAFRTALAEAIEALPERERLVMGLYYDEELNLREVGAVLGVSESRVCQIHGQALLRLKARMSSWRTVAG